MIAQIFFALFFFANICSLTSAEDRFKDPMLENYLYKLRDPQTKRKEFREILEKTGEYLAIEISNELEKKIVSVRTLNDVETVHRIVKEDPILITVLRAGLPLHKGFLNIFPNAECGFLAAKRDEVTAQAKIFYQAIPDIKDKDVILIDSMIATGGSILECLNILQLYQPKHIFIAGVFVTKFSKNVILKKYPEVKIFPAITDPCLNDKYYIVPGCGDAGDRCYGEKV